VGANIENSVLELSDEAIPEPDRRWYVVQTRPRQESRAGAHLGRQGFHVFLPTCLRTVRRRGQFRTSEEPLFPRYLFTRFSVRLSRWRCINSTLGVAKLITANDRPLPVPDEVVDGLISDALAGNATVERFAVGDPIRLTRGPFSGLTGQLAQLDTDGRVRVLLSIMGGEVPMIVQVNALEPAG